MKRGGTLKLDPLHPNIYNTLEYLASKTKLLDLTGTGHLKSVSLSHNALGSTGFELVLKTLPLHSLTHVDLSAVCRGPADFVALEHLTKVLSQVQAHLAVVNVVTS